VVENAETTLIQQVLNGRRECYRPLVEKYQKKVYLLACSMITNSAEAQDIAQEAFLLAYKNLHDLKDWTKYGSWLFGITRNLCYTALRHRKIQPQSLDDFQLENASNVVPMRPTDEDGIDLIDTLLQKLDLLPDKYRNLLRLKYLEDYSYQEISEMLDLPIDRIRSRLFEGRRMLRERVERDRRIENDRS